MEWLLLLLLVLLPQRVVAQRLLPQGEQMPQEVLLAHGY
jgi:hypothetical protein